MMKQANTIDYFTYLNLDKLLNAQHMESTVHDEMLFIITHQTYELWFKQIIHELDDVLQLFNQEVLGDTLIYRVVSRLQRIIKIKQLMISQIKILETMTPMDFLEFRDLLGSSSGLQSYQFRLIEVKLGIRYDKNSSFITNLNETQQNLIHQAMQKPSLATLVEKWLERTPFLATKDFSFWHSYQHAVQNRFASDTQKILQNNEFTDLEKQARLKQIEQAKSHFAALFDDILYDQLVESGDRQMSRLATSAALLIYIYRDQPVLQLPYMLLSALVEVDDLLTAWRYAHIAMVQRMIGQRMGTGGTSGQNYLQHALSSRKIFTDLTNLATFLVRGSELLPLSDSVKQQFGFHYSN